MPKLDKKKLIAEKIDKMKEREARQEESVNFRVLPPNLREQILEGCEAERARILARIDEIDEGLARMDEARRQGLEVKARAVRPIVKPATTKRRLDGTVVHKPAERTGAGLATSESIRVGRFLRTIGRQTAALKKEKAIRQSELGEIRRLEKATRQGIISPLLIIVGEFQAKRVDLGTLAPVVKLARSYTDASGSALPIEAYAPDGTPAPEIRGRG